MMPAHVRCLGLFFALLVPGPALADEANRPPSKLGKGEFNRKYKAYLLDDHVNYVSTEFAEGLIPATGQVLKDNPRASLGSAHTRVLVADRLFLDFSPRQFDEIADFPQYPGPDMQSLNVWCKSLQRSIVESDSLRLRRPLAWWPVYLGVSEAFENKAVIRWARREKNRGGRKSIGDIVVKVVLQSAIRRRYRESAGKFYDIMTAEYARWHDSPARYRVQHSRQRLYQIVLERLDEERRDAELFAGVQAEPES